MSESNQWSLRQIALSRQYVAGEIDSDAFGTEFMRAHNAAARAGEFPDLATSELLDDLLFAVCNHDPGPEPTAPVPLDDQQLRETVARHLAGWDDGAYPPNL